MSAITLNFFASPSLELLHLTHQNVQENRSDWKSPYWVNYRHLQQQLLCLDMQDIFWEQRPDLFKCMWPQDPASVQLEKVKAKLSAQQQTTQLNRLRDLQAARRQFSKLKLAAEAKECILDIQLPTFDTPSEHPEISRINQYNKIIKFTGDLKHPVMSEIDETSVHQSIRMWKPEFAYQITSSNDQRSRAAIMYGAPGCGKVSSKVQSNSDYRECSCSPSLFLHSRF